MASFGLDMFLVPNGFIAGGMTGISALASQLTGLHTGMFLFMLNFPWVIMMFQQSNRNMAIRAAAGITVFSFCSLLLHPLPPLIEGGAAAAAVGGIFLGFGLGVGIKYGAVLDILIPASKIPSPVMAILNRLPLSNAGIVVHIVVLSAAGLLIGLEQAMYSAVACLMAIETARLTTSSIPLKRQVIIQSHYPQEIKDSILQLLGRNDISSHPSGKADRQPDNLQDPLCYHIHLMEISRLKSLVRRIDPNASISVSPIRHK